jgi:hypothetical protein
MVWVPTNAKCIDARNGTEAARKGLHGEAVENKGQQSENIEPHPVIRN